MKMLESPTLKLIRIIGSPFTPDGGGVPTDSDESPELYELAIRNKIPLLYLEALKKRGTLNELKTRYDEENAVYPRFMNAIARLTKILESATVKYVVFKTMKPYPGIPTDIDLMILGDDKQYRKALEVLLKAHYSNVASDIVDTTILSTEDNYKKAVETLMKPTYLADPLKNVSPTGTDFLDPEYSIDIDLQRELAISYVIYMDKNRFEKHVIRTKLPSGQAVNTLTPGFELATVIAHSLIEQIYLLGEYYTFLYYLSRMDEQGLASFIDAVKENRLEVAVRASTAITAELHRVAFGTIPKKLELVSGKLGSDVSEARSLIRHDFKMPHKYSLFTVTRFLLHKMGEQRFRESILNQMIKALNPKLARYVISELIDKRRRQFYLGLEEFKARYQR